MPQLDLDESRESLMRAGETVERGAKRFWSGFTDFALKDNVLEVAVGLMYA
jgi:large conductance mechanosensitive channel